MKLEHLKPPFHHLPQAEADAVVAYERSRRMAPALPIDGHKQILERIPIPDQIALYRCLSSILLEHRIQAGLEFRHILNTDPERKEPRHEIA